MSKIIGSAKSPGSQWWNDFFPSFRPIFSVLSSKFTAAQTLYLINKLDLAAGKKFLDCPCGIGRISIPLAKRGVRVTGVDITRPYLEELSSKARRANLKIELLHCDMRRINFDRQFDAAGNLWTSFGYFEREADNFLVLKKTFRALKPGGKFMLHLINRDHVVRNYTPNDWFESEGVKIFETRRLNLATSISESVWYCIKDGRETICQSKIRLYSYHEILEMMRRAGFVDIEGYGSMKDEPISWDRNMMFVIGVKPK